MNDKRRGKGVTHSVEFKNITKYFPGVKALDDVSFTAKGGEVLAFLGENGAGKSTLLKTLNGDYQATSGEYLLDGRPVHFKSPHEAIEAGVSVIYQERQILMELSIAENIFLGRMPANRFGWIDIREANRRAQEIINDFGLPVKPQTKVKDLSIAYQQMVEIMKAYSRDNLRVICFDEPTASLSDAEIDALFKIRIVALADHSAFQDDVSALITVAHSFHVIAHDIICSVHMRHEGHRKGTLLIGPEDAMDDRSVSISHIQSKLLKLPDKRFLQHTLPLSRRPALSREGRIAHCIKLCIADEASADAFGEINHERSVQQAFVF